MFTFRLMPRYSELDALGHITNTALPVWFEEAREPIFRIFMPDVGLEEWNLILRKLDVDYRREIFHGAEVEIRTFVAHLGNTSFSLEQEAWQNDALATVGTVVLIHFDFEKRQPVPIPETVRRQLAAHQRENDL